MRGKLARAAVTIGLNVAFAAGVAVWAGWLAFVVYVGLCLGALQFQAHQIERDLGWWR